MVLERVLDEHKNGPLNTLIFDLGMLLSSGGRERTAKEYECLLLKAGFDEVGGCGWVWMGVDGCGWVWMGVGGCGWMWMGGWVGEWVWVWMGGWVSGKEGWVCGGKER